MEKISPGSPNTLIVKKKLENLSDAEFELLMDDFEAGRDWISMTIPNGAEYDISVKRNLQIGEEIGHKFFERIWLTDQSTNLEMLTNKPALLLDLLMRRQKQMRVKKGTVASDNRHVDELTGQPTSKESKGSSISFPQALILQSRGLWSSAVEFFKGRAGDAKAFNYMNRAIYETGEVSLNELDRLGSRSKSTEVLGIFFLAQHYDNNL